MRRPLAVRCVQLIVAVAAVVGVDGHKAVAQDRLLSADFPEIYRVGGLNAPEWAFLESSSRAGFDAAGNLYVLDASAGRVVVLDPEGRLAQIIGRKGEGPGEFNRATDLAVWPDGSFAVSDLGHAAYQVFSPDGELKRFVRMSDIQGPMATFRGMRSAIRPDPLAVAIIAQGAASMMNRMARVVGQVMGGEEKYEPGVDDRGLERIRLDGDIVSSTIVLQAWRVPQEDASRDLSAEEQLDLSVIAEMISEDKFFAPRLHWDVLPGGTIAYTDSSDYAIKLAPPGGPVIDVVRRPISPQAVTPRIREGAVAHALDEFETRSNDPRGAAMSGLAAAILPGIMETMREALATREFFHEIPVLRGLRTTWDGGLWVQRRGDNPWDDKGPVDVFTAGHEYLGTFAASAPGMPAAFGPDGRVLYWETNELDVPTIVVKRLPVKIR